MSVKVTTPQKAEQSVKPFPKLMIMESNGLKVLFFNPSEGTVIYNGITAYIIGYYSNNWDMDLFTDYNEPITLQND